MKISMYCTCGASAFGTVSPDGKAEKIQRLWRESHVGPGHAPCDAKTAANARRRQERAEVLDAK